MSTPLEQRQWRASAQRAVRLALTGIKEARGQAAAASEAGHTALAALCNHLLTSGMLPTLQLGPLDKAAPDLRAAAQSKVARLIEENLAALQHHVDGLACACAALQACVASLLEVPPAPGAEPLASSINSAADAPSGTSFEAVASAASISASSISAISTNASMRNAPAVFSSASLPRVVALLQRLADMHAQEAASKRAIAARVTWIVRGEEAQLPGQLPGQLPAAAPDPPRLPAQEVLQGLCTTWLASWMLDPYLEEEVAVETLTALTEDMAGF